MQCLARLIAVVLLSLAAPAWAALDRALVAQLGAEDSEAKIEAIRKLAVSQDPRAIEVLLALGDEALALIDGGKRAVIVAGGRMTDAATGESLGAAPAKRRDHRHQQPDPRRSRLGRRRAEARQHGPGHPPGRRTRTAGLGQRGRAADHRGRGAEGRRRRGQGNPRTGRRGGGDPFRRSGGAPEGGAATRGEHRSAGAADAGDDGHAGQGRQLRGAR